MARLKFFSKSYENEYGKFDSLAEADRYLVLADRQERGEIHNLEPHVSYEIIPKLTRIVPVQLKTKVKYVERTVALPAKYTCDSRYVENGIVIIEEVKSKRTASEKDYILRKKLMLQLIQHWNSEAGQELYQFREVVCDPPKKTKSSRLKRKRKSKSDASTADIQSHSTDTGSTLLYHYVM